MPPEEPLEPAICVACSVFRDELEALRKRGELDLPVRYLDSMLHMRPKRLETQLTAAVGEESFAAGERISRTTDRPPSSAAPLLSIALVRHVQPVCPGTCPSALRGRSSGFCHHLRN